MTTTTGPATFTFTGRDGTNVVAYRYRAEVEAGILSWLDRITPA